MKEAKEGLERPEATLSMVQGLQCFPWPRRQSSPSLQEENMKELVLRRSASERKLAKEKKKERKEKALSVHFGEKTPRGKKLSGGIEAQIQLNLDAMFNHIFICFFQRLTCFLAPSL